MPTNDELRAGAELIADMRSRTPEDSPVIQIARHVWESCLDVANAYLASLPADDGEPVTEEWVNSLIGSSKRHWDFVGPDNKLTIYKAHKESGEFRWCALINDCPYTHSVRVSTRGHVRRLLAALQITPKAGG